MMHWRGRTGSDLWILATEGRRRKGLQGSPESTIGDPSILFHILRLNI
jgi:hypothetical protein